MVESWIDSESRINRIYLWIETYYKKKRGIRDDSNILVLGNWKIEQLDIWIWSSEAKFRLDPLY